MNSNTVSESKNHISINFTKKSDEDTKNISERENNELKDGFEIDVMLPASTLHQYSNL